MRLSKLQKYILAKCYEQKNKPVLKISFYKYYPDKEVKENRLGVQVGIQKSIENLVAKNLAIAFGYRTTKKFYIHKVKLTVRGRRIAKELIKSRQRKLRI